MIFTKAQSERIDKMGKYRRGRINDAVAEALAVAIGEVREPKVINNFVSITRAEVAPDLKYATVYFSCIGESSEALEGLKKCTGMLRQYLDVNLNLHIEHGARKARIIEEINRKDEDSDD